MNTPDIVVLKETLGKMTDEQLNELIDPLFCEFLDERKCLDEQMIVNNEMYANYYLYEARALEAKAKFLYAKAEVMMRKRKSSLEK